MIRGLRASKSQLSTRNKFALFFYLENLQSSVDISTEPRYLEIPTIITNEKPFMVTSVAGLKHQPQNFMSNKFCSLKFNHNLYIFFTLDYVEFEWSVA